MKHNVRNREHNETHTYISLDNQHNYFPRKSLYGRQATLKSNDALDSFFPRKSLWEKTTLKCKHALLSFLVWKICEYKERGNLSRVS